MNSANRTGYSQLSHCQNEKFQNTMYTCNQTDHRSGASARTSMKSTAIWSLPLCHKETFVPNNSGSVATNMFRFLISRLDSMPSKYQKNQDRTRRSMSKEEAGSGTNACQWGLQAHHPHLRI